MIKKIIMNKKLKLISRLTVSIIVLLISLFLISCSGDGLTSQIVNDQVEDFAEDFSDSVDDGVDSISDSIKESKDEFIESISEISLNISA